MRATDVISWLVFPVAVAAVLGGAVWAIDSGHPASLIAGIGTFASLVLVVVLERLLPYRAEWNQSQGDLTADLLYLPSYFGINALVQPLVSAGIVFGGAMLSESVGAGLWPSDWPLLGQFLLACLVVEFFDYWPHRWMHEVPFLWRFHAIHHNPKRLYWLNATRAHFGEVVFRGVFNAIPLALAGAGAEVLVLIGLANSLLGLFQHANINFKLGPLSWIFSVGEMHRWHHSVKVSEANHNYGSNFLFWDVVFGTRYRDAERSGPEQLGIEHDDIPDSWWSQLAVPFKKKPWREDAATVEAVDS
ncbi:sterol desaturase family protein [Litorivivens sp.]|uniref:sterol desaturase family protein n=1 Tax=Litorivivens sp. TaxID=2020868 RepID=UPI0035623069